jgi:hypothetical protein
MAWLERHLREFVLPHLGTDSLDEVVTEYAPVYFTPQELSVIKNIWRSVKKAAQDRVVLLPGRDVYVFEILARRENYPTIFLPSCSRQTAGRLKCELFQDMYLLDTGFAGSIPRALEITSYGLVSYGLRNDDIQVFRHLSMSRGLALKIEKTPKYWKTGRIGYDGEVVQEFSERGEFVEAAILTMQVYKNSAPRFIPHPAPIGKGFRRYWDV